MAINAENYYPTHLAIISLYNMLFPYRHTFSSNAGEFRHVSVGLPIFCDPPGHGRSSSVTLVMVSAGPINVTSFGLFWFLGAISPDSLSKLRIQL